MLSNLFLKTYFFFLRLVRGFKRRIIFLRLGYKPNADISHDLRIKEPKNITIGNNVKIGEEVTIGAMCNVVIEDNVTISQGVLIETGSLSLSEGTREHKCKRIHIKKGAWLAARCIILGGVTIGEGALIGANKVIRKDVNPREIIN